MEKVSVQRRLLSFFVAARSLIYLLNLRPDAEFEN
jgi:hypothetical protein